MTPTKFLLALSAISLAPSADRGRHECGSSGSGYFSSGHRPHVPAARLPAVVGAIRKKRNE